jgi:site-specific recombinase XerD
MKQTSESYAGIANHEEILLFRGIANKITNARDQIIFKLLLETGCKPEELISLRPDNFEFTTCSLKIGRKEKQRRIKLPLDLSLQLNSFINNNQTKERAFKKEQQAEQKFIFSSRQSAYLTTKTVCQIVINASTDFLHKKITPNKLRQLFIKNSFSKNKSLLLTKKQSGLSNLHQKNYLSEEQINNIKDKIKDEQHKILLDILYETGCTLNELINIRVKDFRLHKNSPSIIIRAENSKQNKTRTSKISQDLSLRLKLFAGKRNLSQESFLFSTRQSPKMSDKRVFQLIREYARQAGIGGVGPQIIRNSHIAQALNSEKSQAEIEEQTGVNHLDIHHYGIIKRKQEQRA